MHVNVEVYKPEVSLKGQGAHLQIKGWREDKLETQCPRSPSSAAPHCSANLQHSGRSVPADAVGEDPKEQHKAGAPMSVWRPSAWT